MGYPLFEFLLSSVGWHIARQSAEMDFLAWWAYYHRVAPDWPILDRAILGGFLSDRIAFAFASGYQGAVRQLVPAQPPERVLSFAITEEGGAHPRAINATLQRMSGNNKERFSLTGRKKWITLAAEADLFLVAASTGFSEDGKNKIIIAQVPRDAAGISVSRMPGVPFVPEISHGEVVFSNVVINPEDVLPGDGYTQYIRPFRTVEDIFVSAGLLGHLFRCAREFTWPRTIQEDLLTLIAALHAIAQQDPAAPETHVALGGFIRSQQKLVETVEPLWSNASPAARTRWIRDKAIFLVAEKVRSARLESAWKSIK